ncbi:PAS domain-containing protein [Aquibacillus halophilus]|uniref:HTH-type transcriptional regulatory protein TyrR n=1 Tax=Aquibacillus halophilus TaxID=930132 RepID=A0A6A8D6J6_9BACI|nr:sigma 54-interacting transcriptional regulator [Aquibacillus halophilus]MRH41198.1 PAS domain-containing protein [Aquibacillus halophilus]
MKRHHIIINGKELYLDFKSIINSMFDIVHVTDQEGTTLYCSDNYEDFFGISPLEMIGKNIEEFYDLGYFKPSITKQVISSKKKVSTLQNTFNDRKLFVEGFPYYDASGKFSGVVNVSTDITNEEKLIDELKAVKELGSMYFEEINKKYTENNNEAHLSLVFRSEIMTQTVDLAKRLSKVDSSVTLLGESGVGKGVLARYIHENSFRNKKDFVHINCGAIPENLIESELFGYNKGAFTGADQKGKLGLIEKANGGTLFLDEIGDLPINLQVKLLNVLQEKQITRIGGSKPIDIDIRLITATNKDLKKMVAENSFREDLYYRIFVVPIEVPSLRERVEDISILVSYFMDIFSQKYLLNKKLSEKCYKIFEQYDWPGNVRELENLVERLVVTSNGDVITSDHIPLSISESIDSDTPNIKVNHIINLPKAVEETERQLVQMALKKYSTTVKIAEVLGISQASASRKIKKYSIQ